MKSGPSAGGIETPPALFLGDKSAGVRPPILTRTKTSSLSEVARRPLGIVTVSTPVIPISVIEQRIDDGGDRRVQRPVGVEDAQAPRS